MQKRGPRAYIGLRGPGNWVKFHQRRSAAQKEEAAMDETSEVPEQGQRSYSGLLVGVLAVAVLCALAGLIWSYTLAGRLTKAEAQVESAQQNNQKLQTALNQTNARLQVTTETLGQSLGMTQK